MKILFSFLCLSISCQSFAYNFSTSISSGILTNAQNSKTVEAGSEFGKLSQLDWKIENSPIVNAGITWNVFNNLNLNVNGWTTVSKNMAVLNDYDWNNEFDRNELTDWSNHPNTSLNYANEYDFNLEGLIINKDNIQLGLLAGYQENRLSYETLGGTYHYSILDEDDEFIPGTALSNVGSFTNDPTNFYKLKFKTPYLGLNGKYNYKKLGINLGFKYSPWAEATDYDNHVRTDTIIKSRTRNGTYSAVIANINYMILPDTEIFTEYSWNKFKKNLGDTIRITEEESYFSQNNRTISSKYSRISLGIKYKF